MTGTDRALSPRHVSRALEAGKKANTSERSLRYDIRHLVFPSALDYRLLRKNFVVIVFIVGMVLKICEEKGLLSLASLERVSSGTIMTSLGLFLSFCVTMLVGYSLNRYYTFYLACMAIIGRGVNVAALSRAWLPREYADMMFRFTNVAHMATYMGVMTSSRLHAEWWEEVIMPRVKEFSLLTAREIELIERPLDVIGASYKDSGLRLNRLMIVWCEQVMAERVISEQITPVIGAAFHNELRELRGLAAEINDLYEKPLPNTYLKLLLRAAYAYFLFSVLFVLSSENSVGFAISIIFSAYQIFGLLQVSHDLESPFGLEIDDFPVISYIDFLLVETALMYEAPAYEPPDATEVPSGHVSEAPAGLDDEVAAVRSNSFAM